MFDISLRKFAIPLVFATVTSAGLNSVEPQPPSTCLIVVTDFLPDDVEAMFALKLYTDLKHVSQVLFVTADGDVQKKARALHNFSEALGFANAVVVAGESEKGKAVPSYVQDYLGTNQDYLDRLAQTKIKSDWSNRDRRAEIKRVFDNSEQVEIFLLANPASLMDTLDVMPIQKLSRFVTMGLWKSNSDGTTISAYNTNTNPVAANAFLIWVQEHRIPTIMLGSELFSGLSSVVEKTKDSRSALVQRANHELITQSLVAGLIHFRDSLTNRLIQSYGMSAPFIFSWDPATSAWLQDTVSVVAALAPGAFTYQTVHASLNLTQPDASGLGFPVKVEPGASGTIQMGKSLDQSVVGDWLNKAYLRAKLSDPFDPAKILSDNDDPILWIGKAANDDMGLLRMLLAMGSRLKMVVTESSNSRLTAAIIRKATVGYGRPDVEVVAGKGQTLDEMKAIGNLKLESTLLETGWGKTLLGDDEYKRLQAEQNTSPWISAVNQIEKFLEAQSRPVDVIVTTSVQDLYDVLSKRPDLIKKVKTLHLMGGWRTNDGNLTRNWLIGTEKAAALFALIEANRIETYVYSSHLLGGSITQTQVPNTIKAIEELQELPIEKSIDEIRREWNRAVAVLVPGFDVQGNYGPSLAYMMGVMVGLGRQAAGEGYVKLEQVRLRFRENKTVSHESDRSSSVWLVGDPAQSSMRILDQTASYLFAKARTRLKFENEERCARELPGETVRN